MKITAIKSQVKSPERVSVFVDDKYSFSLSLDEVLKHKVRQGLEIDDSDVKKFKKISEDGKLRMRSLEWLLNRPRSIREFRDYLYRKKAEPELTETLINDFTKRGYLDEHKFGQWYVEVLQRKNKSDRAIRSELFKKGIDRELADELLAGESDETDRLKAIIDKKSKLTRYQKDPQKLKQYLAGQGFSFDAINEELNKT